MDKIDLKKNYEEKVLRIWKKYKDLPIFNEEDKEYRKHPILPHVVHKNRLLFIGMNPSFRKGLKMPESEVGVGFYPHNVNPNTKDIPYFEKIKEVAKYCETEWTHLDLFFLRETNQKIIEQLSHKHINFLNDQLAISFEIIEKANPKLILVCNSFASEFFGKMKKKHQAYDKIWRGFDLFFQDDKNSDRKSTFNPKIGTYEIELNGKKIPIIFSGMLSGQRALDIGSLERLKWQVKTIISIE